VYVISDFWKLWLKFTHLVSVLALHWGQYLVTTNIIFCFDLHPLYHFWLVQYSVGVDKFLLLFYHFLDSFSVLLLEK